MSPEPVRRGGWEVPPGEYLSSAVANEATLPFAEEMRTIEAIEGIRQGPTPNQRTLLAAAALHAGNPHGEEWCQRELERHRRRIGTAEPGSDYAGFLLGAFGAMALFGPGRIARAALGVMRAELVARAIFSFVGPDGLATVHPGIRCGQLSPSGLSRALAEALGGLVPGPALGPRWRDNQRRQRIAGDAVARLARQGTALFTPPEREALAAWILRRGPLEPLLALLRAADAGWSTRFELAVDRDGILDAWFQPAELTDNPRPAVSIRAGEARQLRPCQPPLGFRGRVGTLERFEKEGRAAYRCAFEGVVGNPQDPGEWPAWAGTLEMESLGGPAAARYALGTEGVEEVPLDTPAPEPSGEPPAPERWAKVDEALTRLKAAVEARDLEASRREAEAARAALA